MVSILALAAIGNVRALEREVVSGPVRAWTRVNSAEITTAQTANLDLAVTAPLGMDVTIQEPSTFGKFTLKSEDRPAPQVVSPGTMEYRRHFVLLPFLAGDYRIPSFTVVFQKGAERRTLETAPIPIRVNSVVSGDLSRAPLAGLMSYSVPAPRRISLYLLIGLDVILGGILLGLFLWGKWKPRPPAPAKIMPRAAALEALERCPREDAAALGALVRRYQRESGVALPGDLKTALERIEFGEASPAEIAAGAASFRAYLREQP